MVSPLLSEETTPGMPPSSFWRSLSTFFYRHKSISLILLLLSPLLLLVVIYLGSVLAMLINSFFYLDSFTGQIVREFSFKSYQQLLQPANLSIIRRTVTMAALVAIADALLAFPVAYYMARFASPRMKAFLYLAVLLPLWSSYLVRVYAWRLILAQEGILMWFLTVAHLDGVLEALLKLPGIGGTSLGVSPLGTFIVFTYTWLPYMILPIASALERVPQNVLDASSDLGAKSSTTFWRITLPLALPGVIAGSIFSFSLTLGDFIIPGMVGNSSRFIGQAVLIYQGTAGNLPLAAAFTVVPIVIMALYLLAARRMGAFDAL
jgi:putative spermidine/putrescine transport system permease protein